jgi:hypothetical protein
MLLAAVGSAIGISKTRQREDPDDLLYGEAGACPLSSPLPLLGVVALVACYLPAPRARLGPTDAHPQRKTGFTLRGRGSDGAAARKGRVGTLVLVF